MSYDRVPILTRARDLLAAEWDSTNADGIGPGEADPLALTVHHKGRNAGVSNPQLSVELVDETQSGLGISDGGPKVTTSGLLQVAVVAGSAERLDAGGVGAEPSEVAYRMAQEVKRIWHSKAPTGLAEQSAPGVAYDQIIPGQTRPLPETIAETNPARVGYLQELSYEYEDETPQ